jgi:hypothetical protein
MENQDERQIENISNKGFSDRLKKILEDLKDSILLHQSYSLMLGWFNITFGFIAAILAFLAGSISLIAGGDANAVTYLNIPSEILSGFFGISAGLLTTAITSYNFSARSEKHKVSSAQYGALARQIEEEIIFPAHNPEEAEKRLKSIDARLNEIEQIADHIYSPKFILRIFGRYKKNSLR